MRTSVLPRVALASFITAGALLAAAGVSAQKAVERFTGFAINMNSGPSTATVDFQIERWSTDAERDQLLAILKEEKDVYRANQKLLSALQRLPKVGYIRTPERLAWDLRFARQMPLEDGGRRIVLATDRPIGFREARNQPRTMDYPFLVMDIRMNAEGKGEGKLIPAARIEAGEDGTFEVEGYASEPVRLAEVRSEKSR